ncbi:MAG TPA: DinB family protein, partial [Actinomycetota bacterium]
HDLVAYERSAYRAWRASVQALSPAAARSDGWTIADVLAHVSAWHRYSTDRISTILRDGVDPGPPEDTDAFNERARAEAPPWEELRAEASRAHRRLLDLVATLPDERVADDDGLIAFIVRANGSEHYAEHPASAFDA